MARLYKTDGSEQEVSPANGVAFSYEELQGFIGEVGAVTIQFVPLPSGKTIVVDDNGKLNGSELNPGATKAWCAEYPIEKYPHNNDQLIVGNALIATPKELGDESDE